MKKIILTVSAIVTLSQISFGQVPWSTTGNTPAATNFLGTTDASPLIIKTSNTEWFRLTYNGYFGFGTTTPLAKFEFRLPATYLHTQQYGMRIDYPLAHPSPGSAVINKSIFEVCETGTSASFTKFVVKKEGNVGIGTQTPDARFHVVNNNESKLDSHLEGFTLIDGKEASLLFGRTTGASYGEWGIEYNEHSGGLNFWKPAGGTTGHAGSNYHIFIKNDGRVSMGIDPNIAANYPAGYKLYVADGILTERLKVALISTTDWADYVFKKEYKLLSINEVEKYIAANGHLPGVPSAEEVKESGIDMAKMDAKLLEKIEELTLYLIELKKENVAIKAELEILKR